MRIDLIKLLLTYRLQMNEEYLYEAKGVSEQKAKLSSLSTLLATDSTYNVQNFNRSNDMTLRFSRIQ